MKQKQGNSMESGFRIKLIVQLVSVVVLVGIVAALLGQISQMQQQLDKRTLEWNLVTDQLEQARMEVGAGSNELEFAHIMARNIQSEYFAYYVARETMKCRAYETVGLVNYVLDDNRTFTPEQVNRYEESVEVLLNYTGNEESLFESYCDDNDLLSQISAAHTQAVETRRRAVKLTQKEMNVSTAEFTALSDAFESKVLIGVQAERINELSEEFIADSEELIYRLLGTNGVELMIGRLNERNAAD